MQVRLERRCLGPNKISIVDKYNSAGDIYLHESHEDGIFEVCGG
jgi:hypothetical protein